MSLHDVENFLLHAFLTDSSSVLSFADSASKICFSFGSLSRLCRPRSSLRTARAEATLMHGDLIFLCGPNLVSTSSWFSSLREQRVPVGPSLGLQCRSQILVFAPAR
jgi:hypothetical protein